VLATNKFKQWQADVPFLAKSTPKKLSSSAEIVSKIQPGTTLEV
jgi:hypothetical protein